MHAHCRLTKGSCPILLHRVDEIRPVITHDPNFFLSLAIEHVVPLARLPLPVLDLKHDIDEDGAAEQANALVGKDSAVTGPVARFLLGEEDIGGDDT